LAFVREFWVMTLGIALFPGRNMWTIRGGFVVLVCILLVGNDKDKDRGELCGVDQFGVTEVSESGLCGNKAARELGPFCLLNIGACEDCTRLDRRSLVTRKAQFFQSPIVGVPKEWSLSFYVRNCCIPVMAHALQSH
jgi:hypothetical protein